MRRAVLAVAGACGVVTALVTAHPSRGLWAGLGVAVVAGAVSHAAATYLEQRERGQMEAPGAGAVAVSGSARGAIRTQVREVSRTETVPAWPSWARFLTAIAPERAPAGARISLLVQVTLAAQGVSAALNAFPVGPAGAVVTITVSAPGLVPLGDLEQDLTVPFAADSDPVRSGFRTGPVGLHPIQVRAFAGARAFVRDGKTIGDASLQARRMIAADEGDPTWLAYTVYGNPTASVMHDPPSSRSSQWK